MKEKINLIASVLGIVIFFGSLVSWAYDNKTALIITSILCVVSILFVLHLRRKPLKVVIERVLDDDLWISARRNNRLCVDSSFLSRDESTILFWVLVPSKGVGLRNAPHNKYLFSHHTGEGENSRHYNEFYFRYSSNNTWDFVFSNPNGETPNDLDKYKSKDGLSDGWHHVQISWNHSKPILKLLVDAGSSISVTSKNYLTYWPRELNDCVYFGAWVSNYADSYVETKISRLWICDRCLDVKDPRVIEHRSDA